MNIYSIEEIGAGTWLQQTAATPLEAVRKIAPYLNAGACRDIRPDATDDGVFHMHYGKRSLQTVRYRVTRTGERKVQP